MKVLLNLPEFKDFEYTSERRQVKKYEHYLENGEVKQWKSMYLSQIHYIILRPIRWRNTCGLPYYYIDSTLSIKHVDDFYNKVDQARYDVGNYFQFGNQAKDVINKLRNISL